MSAPSPAPESGPRGARPMLARGVRRGLGWLRTNAWLGLVIGAGLVLSRTVDFAPPPEVRVADHGAGVVGEAPAQEFADELGNAQAVQLRAILRLYPDPAMVVSTPDPEVDEHARVLSQPVVTTILGMNATVEQTVRLEGGDLEVDLSVHATPRLMSKPKGAKAPPLSLESEVHVKSRRQHWLGGEQERVHIDSRATLVNVEDRGYRLVFTVDEHLFALDLELHRPFG